MSRFEFRCKIIIDILMLLLSVFLFIVGLLAIFDGLDYSNSNIYLHSSNKNLTAYYYGDITEQNNFYSLYIVLIGTSIILFIVYLIKMICCVKSYNASKKSLNNMNSDYISNENSLQQKYECLKFARKMCNEKVMSPEEYEEYRIKILKDGPKQP